MKSDFRKLKSENLELKSESLDKDKRIQNLLNKTLYSKPTSRKEMEDRSYASVANKSHAKGKKRMMVKNAKTGESRRRCQVTLLYAGSNLNTEKEIKTYAIEALASVDMNYEENVMEVKDLPSKKVIIQTKNEQAQRELGLACINFGSIEVVTERHGQQIEMQHCLRKYR